MVIYSNTWQLNSSESQRAQKPGTWNTDAFAFKLRDPFPFCLITSLFFFNQEGRGLPMWFIPGLKPQIWPWMVPLKAKGGPDERGTDWKNPQRNALHRLTCHKPLIKNPEQKSTGDKRLHPEVIGGRMWRERTSGWEGAVEIISITNLCWLRDS